MRTIDRDHIVFRTRMSFGTYKGREYNLDMLNDGCPVIDFAESDRMVVIEHEDILPMAARAVGLED